MQLRQLLVVVVVLLLLVVVLVLLLVVVLVLLLLLPLPTSELADRAVKELAFFGPPLPVWSLPLPV
jgi:hypothetical protein